MDARKAWLMLLIVSAGVGCSNAWAQTVLLPGMWRVTVTTTTNGKPDPDQDSQVCLKDELKDVARYFAPELEGVKASCTRAKRPTGDNNVMAYRMTCKGKGFTMEAGSNVTIVSATHFKLHLEMDTKTSTERAVVVGEGEAKYVGPCPPT